MNKLFRYTSCFLASVFAFGFTGCADKTSGDDSFDKFISEQNKTSQVVGKKNILWIMTDEQRVDTLGCYGNPWVKTPNLDALASDGTIFTNFHSNSPVCVPSRFAFITGLYPQQSGIADNSAAIPQRFGGYVWPEELETYPEILENNGYYTANAGKVHLPQRTEHSMSDGDDIYSDNHPFELFHEEVGYTNIKNQPGYTEEDEKYEIIHLNDKKDGIIISGFYPGEVTPTRHVGEMTVDLIENRPQDKPFLIMSSYCSPHTPVLPAKEFYDLYDLELMDYDVPTKEIMDDMPEFFKKNIPGSNHMLDENGDFIHNDEEIRRARASYYASVTEVDYYIGQTIQKLKDEGIYEDTIILFTSDHGNLIGEYGQFQKSQIYDLVTRVPMIMAGPGIPKGVVNDNIYESVDVVPTLFSKIGLQIPERMYGVDMFNPERTKSFVIGAITATSSPHMRYFIRDERYCLDFTGIVYGNPARVSEYDGKLVDLLNDPLEHDNLFYEPDYEDVKNRLLKQLIDKMYEIGAEVK